MNFRGKDKKNKKTIADTGKMNLNNKKCRGKETKYT